MTKNIIIFLLTAGIVVVSSVFDKRKSQQHYIEKKIIVKDTVYIHDTVFITPNSDVTSRNNFITTSHMQKTESTDNPYKDADLTYKIISSENNTYGYDILISGRAMIHQPNIPGMPGNDGFKSEESARKIAELVIKKIRNNEMPPSVSIIEMKKMNVLN